MQQFYRVKFLSRKFKMEAQDFSRLERRAQLFLLDKYSTKFQMKLIIIKVKKIV